jgi:membrane-associated HD superfamily phosphohydrolase
VEIILAQIGDHHGFLPTRGSFMLDFVFVAMIAIIPVMIWSIVYLARRRHNYQLHKRVQITLALVLLVAVVLFEIDIRFLTDWEAWAAASPYFEPDVWCTVWYALVVHLCFAVPTPFLWAFVIVQALKRFPRPVAPSDYSPQHIFRARLAAFGMLMTAVTGWVFYWLAFVA